MKITKNIIASVVFLATSTFAIGATDTTDIEINVTTDASLDLGDYSIDYAGITNSFAVSNDYVATTCNEAASNFTMTSPELPAVVIAATYSDTLTVTTQ